MAIPRRNRVCPSARLTLGCWLLAAGIAGAQAPEPESPPAQAPASPPAPATPPAPASTPARDVAGDLGATSAPAPAPASARRALRLDALTAPKAPEPWPRRAWLFGPDIRLSCPGCGADGLAPRRNLNAPWTLASAWQVGRGATVFGASLVGQRGANAPLYLQGPIDAAARTTPSSWVAMGDTRTQWDLVLRTERRLFRTRGGVTVSLFGEGFVPLGAAGATPPGGVPGLAQGALLVGIRIRW